MGEDRQRRANLTHFVLASGCTDSWYTKIAVLIVIVNLECISAQVHIDCVTALLN